MADEELDVLGMANELARAWSLLERMLEASGVGRAYDIFVKHDAHAMYRERATTEEMRVLVPVPLLLEAHDLLRGRPGETLGQRPPR